MKFSTYPDAMGGALRGDRQHTDDGLATALAGALGFAAGLVFGLVSGELLEPGEYVTTLFEPTPVMFPRRPPGPASGSSSSGPWNSGRSRSRKRLKNSLNTREAVRGTDLKAELFRIQIKIFHPSVHSLTNARRGSSGKFVQTIVTVDHPGSLTAQAQQGTAQLLGQIRGIDPHDLLGSRSRISQGP